MKPGPFYITVLILLSSFDFQNAEYRAIRFLEVEANINKRNKSTILIHRQQHYQK